MSNFELNLIRKNILKSCNKTKEGHVGSAFSILELLFIIFKKYIKKNFFVLSKGHASIGAYAVMYHFKIINKKIICIVGDQELMEGTTWESLHIIENYKIKNLVLIIDRNNSDFRSIKFFDLKKKLSTFSNKIYEINGHNLIEIDNILKICLKNNSFNIIIANTVKGYGIKEIANNPAWHHKVPTDEELKKFEKELNL